MAAAACQAPGTLQTCLELAALATAPGCARGHVRSVATEWGLAGLPVRRNSGFDDERGRGLMLVDHLAKDWGAYRGETGKVVWVLIGGP
jgi:hypothetical protein